MILRDAARALFVCAALALAACEDASPLATAHPIFDAVAAALDFGKIPEGERAEKMLEIQNAGQVPGGVTLALDGSSSRDFSLGEDSVTVEATSVGAILVTFVPVGAGSDEGVVRISTDDPEKPSLEVTLRGGPIAPDITAMPDPVDFGPAMMNTIARPVSIVNRGDADLHISEILIDADANDDFSLRSIVIPEKLLVGAELELTIDYARSARGTPGRLLVRSDDLDTPELAVRLLPDPFRACENGLDDDEDNLIDFPDDPGCTSATDDDEENPPECDDGTMESCGSNAGTCVPGMRTCVNRRWGPCDGEIGPVAELCDGLNNDCDTRTDEAVTENCDIFGCAGVRVCVEDSMMSGGEWGACLPVSSSPEECDGEDDDCNGMIDDGIIEACMINDCAGQRACVPGGSGQFTACQPVMSPEVCDGADNDCNGADDDGLGDLNCGVGACARTAAACVAGMPGTCTPGQAVPEACNNADDNCDGSVDDGIPNITCGTGACFRSVAGCSSGMPGVCSPGTPSMELCNNADDNCDGTADNGIPNVTCGTGACFRSVAGCVSGMPGVCSPGSPSGEVCNNSDDNCDGVADNGIPNLTCGTGACFRSVAACNAGMPNTCSPGAPATEVCNNADDNCDGTADNGIPNLTCGTGSCFRSVAACNAGMPNTCSPGAPATETCNNADDNCDGTADNGIPNLTCGTGACFRSVAACNAGMPNSCTPGNATAETCNMIDDDCNGVVDNGACAACGLMSTGADPQEPNNSQATANPVVPPGAIGVHTYDYDITLPVGDSDWIAFEFPAAGTASWADMSASITCVSWAGAGCGTSQPVVGLEAWYFDACSGAQFEGSNSGLTGLATVSSNGPVSPFGICSPQIFRVRALASTTVCTGEALNAHLRVTITWTP